MAPLTTVEFVRKAQETGKLGARLWFQSYYYMLLVIRVADPGGLDSDPYPTLGEKKPDPGPKKLN